MKLHVAAAVLCAYSVLGSTNSASQPARRIPGVDAIAVGEDVGRSTFVSPPTDYLIDATPYVAEARRDQAGRTISLSNGLIRRSWRVAPNGACVAFDNLMTGQSMLRAVRPEARVTINGVATPVGGLVGQPNQAFLSNEWLDSLTSDPAALRLVVVRVGEPDERVDWGRRRSHAPDAVWPPRGVSLTMDYRPAKDTGADYLVTVHYEMYDGLPAMCKRISVTNESASDLTVDRFRGEELAVVEHANWVETRGDLRIPTPDCLHAETDFAFGGFTHANANRHAIHWRPDPDFKTQVNYNLQTPCLLVAEPTLGPAQVVKPGETFTGFHTFELVYDDGNRERRGMALRKMYRVLAPWVTENPITHHLLSSDLGQVRRAIDQAKEVGFEAVIMSFGSGFNMENMAPEHLEKWKAVADYAESQGIELGSYSLFSSRSVGGGNDVVSPEGQRPAFGRAPAATSDWGVNYFKNLQSFFEATGFDQFENDGPYPGDVDVTPRPPYQQGEQDSRWAQWRIVADLYRALRASGIYINQPDYYFLVGGNKTGMGYRETNWSLPRSQQVIHTRQNIYDGTWTKSPSMGWMHVPLAQYHGGGAEATIEPLEEHLDHYERIMLSNLGLGVQAHYRGPRLFDTDRTKQKVKETVAWFKRYRDILESDLIHCRRADGRGLDWMLHVNPELEHKGMLCVYNPLDKAVSRQTLVDLYYTGLTDSAHVRDASGNVSDVELDRRSRARMVVAAPAQGMAWYLFW
ncbi:hypothetical protein KOR34_29790 [Posidoniimonas corsicana]|uniref:Alpha-galactosidase n=1 Tax=Posidoniimonas corsicana TaxID=1938618 RepID=A0A5C5VJX7_9BACT|nr:alpha-galactosidase [Posidoniimonas corsicana]TWT38012.1 hypothetical protein KOR34_29790 [Posidoniimonas corsicana]